MATFGALREAVLTQAGVSDHFAFRKLSPAHDAFWDKMNEVEYVRGYAEEYLKPESPALWQMDLLTDAEFADWIARFNSLPKTS